MTEAGIRHPTRRAEKRPSPAASDEAAAEAKSIRLTASVLKSPGAPAASLHEEEEEAVTFTPNIASLPSELLTEIFAYVPRSARLRALSLVCKRWRVAAIRSIKTFSWAPPAAAAAAADGYQRSTPPLSARLALMPSLTHVAFNCDAGDEVVPTTLHSLTLASVGQQRLLAAAAHYPHLTALCIDSFLVTMDLPPLHETFGRFAAAHCAQVTDLKVFDADDALPALAALHWPALRKLSISYKPYSSSFALGRQLTERAPALCEQSLEGIPSAELLALPPHCLTALTSVHIRGSLTPACVHRLAQLTTLRSFGVRLTTGNWSALDIDPGFVARTLYRADHGFIEDRPEQQFTAIKELYTWARLPPNVSVRYLTYVTLCGESAHAVVGSAVELLRRFPRVGFLRLSAYCDAHNNNETNTTDFTQLLHQLIGLAVAANVSTVSLEARGGLPRIGSLPPSVQCGWLKFAQHGTA